jgi:fructose 1,6-bisphosphatase
LRNGFWLIHVKDGSTAIRQEIYPDKAHISAAARLMEDKLVDIIRKAGEAIPNKIPLTEEEKKDWEKFIKKHGDSFNTLAYPSIQENAEKIIAALIGKENK